MKKNQFFGAWCPSVTPFNEQNKIDFDGLASHFQFLSDARIDGILLMGSIGEFATMSIDERIVLIQQARNLTNLPMIAHISTTHVPDLIEMADQAQICGYEAVMVLPHYYYGQTEKQLIDYYLDLDGKIALPWFIYNFPARTGCDINSSIINTLLENTSNFIGIKDTVDTLSHTRNIVMNMPKERDNFSVFAGYDEYYLPNLINGGAGVLSGMTNLFPSLFRGVKEAYLSGDLSQAVYNHQKISKAMEIYSIGEDFITTIKTTVSLKNGYIRPNSRNYASKLNDKQLKNIEKILSEI